MRPILRVFCTVLLVLLAGTSVFAQDASNPRIIEAQFGSDVQSRMIVGVDTAFALGSKVYLWLKVGGAEGSTLKVTWRHADTMRETELAIGGDPWRTWAWKNATLPGEWTVTVTGPGDAVLHEARFTVR